MISALLGCHATYIGIVSYRRFGMSRNVYWYSRLPKFRHVTKRILVARVTKVSGRHATYIGIVRATSVSGCHATYIGKVRFTDVSRCHATYISIVRLIDVSRCHETYIGMVSVVDVSGCHATHIGMVIYRRFGMSRNVYW